MLSSFGLHCTIIINKTQNFKTYFDATVLGCKVGFVAPRAAKPKILIFLPNVSPDKTQNFKMYFDATELGWKIGFVALRVAKPKMLFFCQMYHPTKLKTLKCILMQPY